MANENGSNVRFLVFGVRPARSALNYDYVLSIGLPLFARRTCK